MSELDYVRERLKATKGRWLRIAEESGVSHRAIYNVVYAKNDPRTSTVQALADWLRADEEQAAIRGTAAQRVA